MMRNRWLDGGIAGCSLYTQPELLTTEQIAIAAITITAAFDVGLATGSS